MLKKVFTVLLVLALLNFFIIPAFSVTEEELEESRRREEALKTAMGVLAIITALYLLSHWHSSFTDTSISKQEDKHIQFRLDFESSGITPWDYDEKNEQYSPVLKITYVF